jgi:DNA-binding MarR family transcriptional regulator
MDQEEKEKVSDRLRRLERKRLLRVAQRMERVKNIAEKLGEELDPEGDEFAVELRARLHVNQAKEDRWGNRIRRSATKRRFRDGFKPPRSWDAGDPKGLMVIDKVLTYLSTFHGMELGFRQIHIMIMVAGENPLSMQQAADLSGLTFYAIRNSVRAMEEKGFLKREFTPRSGGQTPLCNISLTARGAGVLRALNRFDPYKLDSYDKMVAAGTPNIPTDLRVLRMKEIIDEATNTNNDI